MKFKKFARVLLAVMVIAAVFVIPAFAQGSTPPVETPQDSLSQIVKALFELVIALFAVAIGSERGTQLIKVFWNLIVEKFAPHLNLKDQRSFILAAVFAFFLTFYFKIDLTQYLKLFDGFDADLLQTVNALLVFFVSTKIHGYKITS